MQALESTPRGRRLQSLSVPPKYQTTKARLPHTSYTLPGLHFVSLADAAARPSDPSQCPCVGALRRFKSRGWSMAKKSERSARLLVQALYRAMDGEPRWWVLPANLNDITKQAIAATVSRGCMLERGDSVCLTDAGRDLVEGR
jgi:hypothetical protein